jgi:cytochrome c5
MRLSNLALIVSGMVFATLMGRAVATEAQTVAPAGAVAQPPGPGLDLINQRCIYCHSTAQIFSARKTPQEWAETVQKMADRGAEVSPEEQQVMVAYLAKNFASDGHSSSPAANGSSATESPDKAEAPPSGKSPGSGPHS